MTLGLPSVVFAIVGGLVTPYLPVQTLKIVLAAFLIVLSGALLWRRDWTLPSTPLAAAVGGAVSGGMAGLVGTGGAVRGLTLAAFNLPKEVFVATSAAIDMGIDVARTLVYAGNGYLHLHDLAWAPLLALVAMAGTWIGRLCLRHVPQDAFRTLLLLLVLVLGIGLVTLFQAAMS